MRDKAAQRSGTSIRLPTMAPHSVWKLLIVGALSGLAVASSSYAANWDSCADDLHLTSHCFDEPECLAIVGQCLIVIAIHGCKGTHERVLLGGRNAALKSHLAAAIRSVGVAAETDGHAFPAMDTNNICNRGLTGQGVQLEFSAALRGAATEERVVSAIRSVLVSVNAAA